MSYKRALGIVVLALIISTYFYSWMPEQIALHWNAQGQVNGYGKRISIFFIPILLAGLLLLFIVIPKIDPLKNIGKFKKYYDGLIIVLFLFLLALQIQIIMWNLGYVISPNYVLPIAIGLLFYYVGILSENSKRNWFVGIRTPWTLSSDKVWKKTHKLAGKLFKISGVITATGIFFPNYAVYFILVPALGVTAYTIVYSYLEYSKLS